MTECPCCGQRIMPTREDIAELRQTGMSYKAIAERYGVSVGQAHKLARKPKPAILRTARERLTAALA